ITIDYTAVIVEPEKKTAPNQGQKPAQKTEIEIKQLSEWKEKAQKEETEKNQNQKQMPFVPQVISLDLSMWDKTKKRGTSFVFTYKVPGEFALKKTTEDLTGKMLGTLKEMFGQIVPPNKPTQVAQRQQSPFTFGQRRR